MLKNNLNKDTLLKYISPVEITLKALNLNDLPKSNISSPFTEDKNPSFKVFKNGDFKCFSSGKTGDCFQLVADINDLDCQNNFNEVLEIVATENDLLLQLGLVEVGNQNKNSGFIGVKGYKRSKTEVATTIATEKQPFVFASIDTIQFAERHLLFWKQFGVSIETLKKYNVSAVGSYSFFSEKLNKECKFTFNENEIAFCYNVNNRKEVYVPQQKTKKKTFLNSLTPNDIFGLQQIDKKVESIIICAGKKDALVLNENNFNAISFRSENQYIKKEEIELLQQYCNNLFICYDNDKAGLEAVKRIIELYPQIKQLQLPADANDVAEFFVMKGQNEFVEFFNKSLVNIDKSEIKETPTIFHIVEDYINENYDLRFNIISLELEISNKNEEVWESCNENSLWLELQKKSIKIPQNSLIAILKSNIIPKFNPIVSYFENLKEWDKETDFITKFTDYLILDDKEDREQLEYHFKKWCVRVVKCAIQEDYFNKQAFVLTDEGDGQNIGKSSWCRFLCPRELDNYLAEDIGNDKDSRILLCKNFLINLDELAVLSRKEINQLKSYFSKDKINERLPYDRKNSNIPRVASFIGSTNMSTFLQDETGSVRWLCFIVKKIDWNYKKEFNIDNLWAQAYSLAQDEEFDETMSFEDIKKNEERNDKFQITTPEKDFLHRFFEVATKIEDAEFLTSSDILNYINLYISSGIRLNNVAMGKALKSCGHKRIKKDGIYGYWVKKKPII